MRTKAVTAVVVSGKGPGTLTGPDPRDQGEAMGAAGLWRRSEPSAADLFPSPSLPAAVLVPLSPSPGFVPVPCSSSSFCPSSSCCSPEHPE